MSDTQDTEQTEAPPKRGRPSNDEVYQRGYDEGFKAGIHQAAFGAKSLFERCKDFAQENWRLPDEALRESFREMAEEDNGKQLGRADVELVLGIARRKRTSDSAEREAIKSLVRTNRGGRDA